MRKRVIKFRVWNKKANQMAYFGEPDIITNSPTTYLSFTLYGWSPGQYENDHYSHVLDTDSDYGKCPIVMQYTGLKDCSGKEVYDGDIVEFVWDTHSRGRDVAKSELHKSRGGNPIDRWAIAKFGQFSWRWKVIHPDMNDGKKSLGFGPGDTSTVEVIGNIYEQPELLTPNNQTT